MKKSMIKVAKYKQVVQVTLTEDLLKYQRLLIGFPIITMSWID